MNPSAKNRFFRHVLATACLAIVGFPFAANANFSGPYDVTKWSLQNTGASNGSIDTAGAPNSIILTGGNSGSLTLGTTDFTIAAVAAGNVAFDFSYFTVDDPGKDAAHFLLNGVQFFLAGINGASGSSSFAVNQGDIFGFQVFTIDNVGGPGQLTISNFNGPLASASVPDTGTSALLFGVSLVALLLVQRRWRVAL